MLSWLFSSSKSRPAATRSKSHYYAGDALLPGSPRKVNETAGPRSIRTLLSLDGGGVHGLVTVAFLQELEKETGYLIRDIFDGVTGNSVGALLAASFVYANKTADEIMAQLATPQGLAHLLRQKHDLTLDAVESTIDPLHMTTTRFDGEAKTQFINSHLPAIPFGSPPSNNLVLIPVTDISRGQGVFFKSYDPQDGKKGVMIANVVDASSCFPGWFPAVKIVGAKPSQGQKDAIEWGIDGGIFANNPADVLYGDFLELFPGADIRVLSVGIGEQLIRAVNAEARQYSLPEWVVKGSLVDMMYYFTQDAVHERMIRYSQSHQHGYVRVDALVDWKFDAGTVRQDMIDFSIKLGKDFWFEHKQDILGLIAPRLAELKNGTAWDRKVDGKLSYSKRPML